MASLKQTENILKFTYGIVPVVAGIDKFTNLLTNWVDYLGTARNLIPFAPETFMKIIGIVEIITGIIVFIRPLAGAHIVMVLLLCIAIELVVATHFYDVAVRDAVMGIGAFALAQLAKHNAATNRR